MKTQQKGFTLIELIIVIVVLGILAVTAAPQFLNFSTDARESTLQGLQGSVKAASDIVYGKSLIAGNSGIEKGKCGEDGDEACESDGFEVSFGYPVAVLSTAGKTAGANGTPLKTIFEAIQNSDWDSAYLGSGTEFSGTVPAGSIAIFPKGLPTATWSAAAGSEKGCFLLYTEVTTAAVTEGEKTPKVKLVTDGC